MWQTTGWDMSRCGGRVWLLILWMIRPPGFTGISIKGLQQIDSSDRVLYTLLCVSSIFFPMLNPPTSTYLLADPPAWLHSTTSPPCLSSLLVSMGYQLCIKGNSVFCVFVLFFCACVLCLLFVSVCFVFVLSVFFVCVFVCVTIEATALWIPSTGIINSSGMNECRSLM